MKFDINSDMLSDGFIQAALVCVALIILDLYAGRIFIAKTAGLMLTREEDPLIYWLIISFYGVFMGLFIKTYFSYKKRSQRK